jgi:hypothetical protein
MPCPSWSALGVENRMLIVSRNAKIAPSYTTDERCFGENVRDAMKRAIAISMKPLTLETA